MRKLLLVAISVLMLSSPAIAVEGYVQEPQEGEVYYVANLVWTCSGDSKRASITMGPFKIDVFARKWVRAAHSTANARAGVESVGWNVNSRIYLEDDPEIWLDPNDFGQMLRNKAESCGG